MKQFKVGPFLLLVALLASPAPGQTRSWSSPVSGAFDDAARWDPNDAPDTAVESALFDRTGSYDVRFADGAQPTIDDLSVTLGQVEMRSLGLLGATVAVSGKLLVNNAELELSDAFGVTLEVADGASVLDAAELTVLSGSGFEAPSTTVGGGENFTRSQLTFNGSVNAVLGDTVVAGPSEGDYQGALTVVNGAVATVDRFDIAPAGSTARGILEIIGGSVVQSPGGVATFGSAEGESASFAFISLFEGGSFEGAEVRVLPTGTISNSGGGLVIRDALRIEGGVYRELGAATHAFGAGAVVAASNGGELMFGSDAVTLFAGQSLELDNGTLDAPDGLVLTGGQANVLAGGATINAPTSLGTGSTFTVAAGSTAVFTDTFSNTGGGFSVASGGEARFESSYEGDGIAGAGKVVFQAIVEPGQSPGVATLGGDAELTDGATLSVELAGAGPGEYDALAAAGTVALGGELRVELIEPESGGGVFSPQEGDRFTLITASELGGDFETLTLPALSGGLEWRVASRLGSLDLAVVQPGVAGDYNHDGVVNAADYTVWRDTLGVTGPLLIADGDGDSDTDADDYAVWRNAFGAIAPARAVPEPRAVVLAALAAVAAVARRAGRREDACLAA